LNLQAKDILFLQNRVAYVRDELAYKKLYFHFYTSLHRFTVGIVNDFELAEEIVSDTMMKIWDMGNKLATIEKLDAYLFRSIKNACFTFLAKRKLETSQIDFVATNSISDYENPETQMLVSEMAKKINSCVNELPPQCVMVFKLIKEEGFSYKKVSGILEISQNTIETHMRIALKRIRASLSNYLSEKIK
jgi:RNA polymerase sigma-70 factor (family 1)